MRQWGKAARGRRGARRRCTPHAGVGARRDFSLTHKPHKKRCFANACSERAHAMQLRSAFVAALAKACMPPSTTPCASRRSAVRWGVAQPDLRKTAQTFSAARGARTGRDARDRRDRHHLDGIVGSHRRRRTTRDDAAAPIVLRASAGALHRRHDSLGTRRNAGRRRRVPSRTTDNSPQRTRTRMGENTGPETPAPKTTMPAR